MKKSSTARFIAAVLTSASFTAMAQMPPILGLPFGQKLDRDIQNCSDRNDAKDYCSISGRASKESPPSSSIFKRPNETAPFALPSWMGWSDTVSVTFDGAGALVGILVTTVGPSEQERVIASLEDRFGKPTTRSTKAVQNAYGAKWDAVSVTWELPQIYIYFGNCSLSKCALAFNTPEQQAAEMERYLQRKKGDKL